VRDREGSSAFSDSMTVASPVGASDSSLQAAQLESERSSLDVVLTDSVPSEGGFVYRLAVSVAGGAELVRMPGVFVGERPRRVAGGFFVGIGVDLQGDASSIIRLDISEGKPTLISSNFPSDSCGRPFAGASVSPDGSHVAFVCSGMSGSAVGVIRSLADWSLAFRSDPVGGFLYEAPPGQVAWRDSVSAVFRLPQYSEYGPPGAMEVVGFTSMQSMKAAQAREDESEEARKAEERSRDVATAELRLRIADECARVIGYLNYARLLAMSERGNVPSRAVELFAGCVARGGRSRD